MIQNVGLCICLWDLLQASEGLISQSAGSGMVNINVEFRLTVFRPFKGEILQGVILDHDTTGIRLSMDFFYDIWVPAESLFEGSVYRFRDDGHVWIWETEDGQEFFYDCNEVVRFRVEEEVWNDHAPSRPPGEEDEDDESEVNVAKGEDRASNGAHYAYDADGNRVKIKEVPYTIIGSMASPTLGPIFWWKEEQEEQEADEAMVSTS